MTVRVLLSVRADQALKHHPGFLQLGEDRVITVHGPTDGEHIERAHHHGGEDFRGKLPA
jgi:hypothetical protein